MYPTRVVGRTQVAARETGDAAAGDEERRAIEQVLGGETQAYRMLVERHQRGVHAVIYRLVHNAADADDLAQQAFLAAFDALPRFRLDLKFSSWLYRIAVNLAKDHLKSKKRGELGLPEGIDAREAAFAGTLPDPDSATIAGERARLLERALARLSIADREVLVLKDIEELPYEELRQILGRPVTALKIRVLRARARLKRALDELAGQGAL
jgi:RNA polymerase sigma-70 factor (ECF subfamily)